MRWVMLVTVAGCADRHSEPRAREVRASRIDAADLVMNEIAVDPGTSGDTNCDGVANVTADEFVELVNTSASDVDLSGGTLSDGVQVRHTFPAGTVVPAGVALVVFGGGSPERCAGVPSSTVLQTASTGALGLNNDGDHVVVLGPEGETLGDHTYGSEGNADQSLVRSPELTGGWVQHGTVSDSPFSPGTLADGGPFGSVEIPGDDDDDTEDTDVPTCGDGLDCAACDAAGFLAPTTGLLGDALVEVLNDLTRNHDCNSYSADSDFLFVGLDGADGDVECVYTGRITDVNGDKPSNSDMNTEHSWPQSLGASQNPARCDLHHLYPSDSWTNSVRGNLPFGLVVTVTNDEVQGGSRVGDDATGRRVFEPRDVHKGNVSRSMAYFAMRYGHELSSSEIALYRAWSASDPPDATEIARTGIIADRQGAPNPFVLCPWLVDQL